MEAIDVIPVKALTSGKYQVLSYVTCQSKYGPTFIVDAIRVPDSDVTRHSKYEPTFIIDAISGTDNDMTTTHIVEPVHFWSTSHLTNYIDKFQPKKKFYIEVKEGQIIIEGYRRKVILT
jgi:hypothetical protein